MVLIHFQGEFLTKDKSDSHSHVYTIYNYSVYNDSLQLIIIQGMWQIFRGIFIWFLKRELRIFRPLIIRKDTELFQTYSNSFFFSIDLIQALASGILLI